MNFPGIDSIGKGLIVAGCILILIGIVIYFGNKIIPLGRLPGDFHWERESFSFHFPFMTSLVISVILTAILNFLLKR